MAQIRQEGAAHSNVKNPFFDINLSPNAEDYQLKGSPVGSGPVEIGGDWLRFDRDAIVASNRGLIIHQYDDLASKNWLRENGDKTLMPLPSELGGWLEEGNIGGFTKGDKGDIHYFIGGSFPCQAYVSEIWLAPHKWQVNSPSVVLPFRSYQGRPLIPLVGDFHACGKELESAAVQRLGFSPIGAINPSNPSEPLFVHYPVILVGGRSAFVPGQALLVVQDTPEGGVEISNDPNVGRVVSGIGVQFTGVGSRRYLYHSKAGDPTNDEIALKIHHEVPDGLNLVQDRRYRGKQGIFFDLRHQATSSACTGGLSTARTSLERDRVLLRHGVTMSSITVDYAPLVQRGELEKVLGKKVEMLDPETQVSVKVILDTTIRVSEFVAVEFSSEVICALIGISSDTTKTEEMKVAFFNRFCATIGNNVSRLLELGFYFSDSDNIADNTSAMDGFLDSENLVQMSDVTECGPLLRNYCKMVGDVGKRLGISADVVLDTIVSTIAKDTLKKSFGAFESLVKGLRQNFTSEEIIPNFGAVIAQQWVKDVLRIVQEPVSVQELIRACRNIPRITDRVEEILGLPPEVIKGLDIKDLARQVAKPDGELVPIETVGSHLLNALIDYCVTIRRGRRVEPYPTLNVFKLPAMQTEG